VPQTLGVVEKFESTSPSAVGQHIQVTDIRDALELGAVELATDLLTKRVKKDTWRYDAPRVPLGDIGLKDGVILTLKARLASKPYNIRTLSRLLENFLYVYAFNCQDGATLVGPPSVVVLSHGGGVLSVTLKQRFADE
jgi:hypothetical protein